MSVKKGTVLMQPLLSVQEAALLLGVCRQTVYNYIYHEGLPSITVGHIRRIHPDSLNQWLLERESTYGKHPARAS